MTIGLLGVTTGLDGVKTGVLVVLPVPSGTEAVVVVEEIGNGGEDEW